jgi:hypothetical protein
MSYVPNSLPIFQAAFSGAIAGMGASNRQPNDPLPSDPVNTGLAKVAGAFAIAYDIAWGMLAANQLNVESTQEVCSAAWWGRAPQANVTSNLNPNNFAELADALVAIVDAGDSYFASQGITPSPISSAPSAGPITPPINGSWSVPDWWIDPQNGKDTNSGINELAPLKTYQRLTELWGTISPIIEQVTTIHFLTSQIDNSDPVIWTPYSNAPGAYPLITGVPTIVAGGITSGRVAKNRNTGQLLEVTLSGAVTANQLVDINVSGQHVRCFTYLLAAGTTWQLSQPLDVYTIDSGDQGVSNDNVDNGQPYTVYSLPQVNICVFRPQTMIYDANAANVGYITQLSIADFDGEFSDCFLGPSVSLVDSMSDPTIGRTFIVSNESEDITGFFINVNCQVAYATAASSTMSAIFGGIIASPSLGLESVVNFIGNDVIVATKTIIRNGTTTLVYVESGTTVSVVFTGICIPQNAQGPFIWGPGGPLNVLGMSTIIYPVGGAAACFLLTGGLAINGQTTAFSATIANPSVINGNVALTPAALDAAAGAAGFGGKAWLPGGGSITDYAV